ncbi:MAG: AAA family ATPase [Actinobacteria bacterium]|nr:AAA family ATPase [Actinomycetota bacterium]
MTTVIAVSGKGGTGKTTLSALITRYLVEEGLKPVLAVDADSNSNLDVVLGADMKATIGGVREDMSEKVQKQQLPAGMSKQDVLEMQIEQALVETPDFELISMGRPEGPGCYCAVNNMLRVILDRIEDSYRFVVIDNEAGMEHLSRRTTRGVDIMFIVSDPSRRGLDTAVRIRDLARQLKLDVRRFYLVVSRVRGSLEGPLAEAVEQLDIELAGVITDDPEISRLEEGGEPLTGLGADSEARSAVRGMMKNVLQEVKG